MALAGKMAFWKPGMRIMTDGPNRIPPMTSAMTRGWPKYLSGKYSSRQNMMMMPAWEKKLPC